MRTTDRSGVGQALRILRRPGVWAATAALLLGGFAFAGSSAAETDGLVTPAPLLVAHAPADASGGCDQQASQTPSTADGPDVQKILQRGKLVVGIDTNSYLWGFRDPKSGQLEGFDIDLVHAIAQALLGDPDAVDFLAVPTDQRINALESGEVDMVVRTMTITCDREQQVSFSAPYFTTGQQLIVPGTSQVTGFDSSLKGQRVCTATGSTGEAQLQTSPYKSQEVKVANQLDCLVLMQLGQVDATITDGALAAGQAAQDPSLRLPGALLDTEYYGVAVRHDAWDLVARVNAVIQSYESSGGWQASYQHWLKQGTSKGGTPPVSHWVNEQ